MIDNAWPAVARVLQRAYHEKQRAYVASVAGHYPGLVPWPKPGLNTDFILLPPWALSVAFGVVFGWFARGRFTREPR